MTMNLKSLRVVILNQFDRWGDFMEAIGSFKNGFVVDQIAVAHSSSGIVESAKKILNYFSKAIDVVSSVLDKNKDVVTKIKNEICKIGSDVMSLMIGVRDIVIDVKSGDYPKALIGVFGAFVFLEDAISQLKYAVLDINNIVDKIKDGMSSYQPLSM